MRSSVKVLGAGAALGVVGSAAIVRFRNHRDDGLAGLTKDELYERARAADIPGRSAMSKDELVRALRSAS